MARSRNIKPSFFSNDLLVELPFEARLLFVGLWTLADREGRLENRAKKIKMSLFPADEINVSEQLLNISKLGFIALYNCNGTDVIQIINFSKHQKPHGLEKDSDLPDQNGMYTVYKRNPKNKLVTGKPILLTKDQLNDFYGENPINLTEQATNSNTNNSYETDVHGSNNVIKQDKNSYETVFIPVRNALIPDSLNLIPECGILNPDCGRENPTHEKNQKNENQENTLEQVLKVWIPDVKQLNAWLKQSGLMPMTSELINQILPEINAYYQTKLENGSIRSNQMYSNFVKWVKRDPRLYQQSSDDQQHEGESITRPPDIKPIPVKYGQGLGGVH
ncbi:hypothetical protein P7L54_21250 [Acinetobacter bereziniae]|uniref:DnaT DNA-binding domain-containing protein n=2 Tax=Bacteria TaxID=2 RepID=N9DIT2_ACIBZ|nr:hypothetical protein [Acinetobacter bereziniae]ENV98122.1 hypothetical protein F938_01181 [Acinetobacter bereziniae LMG 1003 = CIP 70.12]MBJ9907500.1 hypothetical protein [Acinetobacter bereziniae]MBJ9928707.1 hypothetical protein [Acinetobacter bereziniae]MDG3558464.1 hypothetical protein [Acinetobacter bereziniae]MDP6001313.1 hypothetical protein [Acinetobacter bereziniae]